MNRYLPQETSSHNAIRKARFGNTVDAAVDLARVNAEIDAKECGDFCNPTQFVASDADLGGYFENEGAIVAANMGGYTGSHGLIIAKRTKNPMILSQADFEDIFEMTLEFFKRSHARFPSRRFPIVNWDSTGPGGASQVHPHFQAQLLSKWYPGKWEAVRRAAAHYAAETQARGGHEVSAEALAASSGDYFNDLASGHASVNLAFALPSDPASHRGGGRALGFVSLTAATGLELVFLAPSLGPELARLFHAVLQVCYKRLGWTGTSASCMLPHYGEAEGTAPVAPVPVMCRLVFRGSYYASSADVSANELFATAIVGNDVFEVARTIRDGLLEL